MEFKVGDKVMLKNNSFSDIFWEKYGKGKLLTIIGLDEEVAEIDIKEIYGDNVFNNTLQMEDVEFYCEKQDSKKA